MNEYQITFFVDDPTANSHVAQPLARLAKKFKSTIRIVNITQNRTADLSKSVAMLQVGLLRGDLCQITAVGIDACLLYTSPSPRDRQKSRMPSSA